MQFTSENVALIAALLAFVASIISAAVSIYAARFRRFVSERWWDRKADAYTAIVNALSALVEFGEREYNDAIKVEKISEMESDRLFHEWVQGNAAIAKATHIGAFMISERARDALHRRAKLVAPDPRIDWQLELERDLEVNRKCLGEIVAAAIDDLRVTHWR